MEEINLAQVSDSMIGLYTGDAIVTCIGKYAVIKDLLSSILIETDGLIPIMKASFENNDDDYMIILDQDGIWVSKVTEFYTNYLYIQSDCSSKLLRFAASEPIQTFIYEVQTCDGDCENCPYCDDEDEEDNEEIISSGDMNGFSMTKTDEHGSATFSFYSQDINMVEKMRQDWKRYLLGE